MNMHGDIEQEKKKRNLSICEKNVSIMPPCGLAESLLPNYMHAFWFIINQLTNPCMMTRYHHVGMLSIVQPSQATNQNMQAGP